MQKVGGQTGKYNCRKESVFTFSDIENQRVLVQLHLAWTQLKSSIENLSSGLI
jgi:hypothetical protein